MKLKIFKGFKFIFIVFICFICIMGYKVNEELDYKVQFELNGETDGTIQLFYDIIGDQQWKEENSIRLALESKNEWKKMQGVLPHNIQNLRIDFDNVDSESSNSTYYFKSLTVNLNKTYVLDNKEMISKIKQYNQLNVSEYEDEVIKFSQTGADPYVVLDFSDYYSKVKEINNNAYLFYFFISSLIGIILIKIPFCFANVLDSFRNLKQNKSLILNLAFNDFKTKYASSYLGIIWGFVNPSITILVYWFVFQVAFKSGDINNIPYILWFLCAIVPWFYFSEALNAATNSFIEYSYLVKKVKFNIDILPFIKIISSLFVHLFFVGVVFIVMSLYGFYPNVYNLQVFYYIMCMLLLVYAVTLFTSSVVLFFRDLGQIITIIVNVGFWFTPIGWNLAIIPVQFQLYLKMNPMYYIVQGFRDSFVANNFFWERPYQTIYFWFFVLLMLFMGVTMFKKLRPHFADVL